ncbi:MAG: DUF3450 domain-containing protein [Gammaproteobacteria bacterium]|nr:DUF3450 domain-containing protein [Gammaproteobacteria bacterium]
MINHLGGAPRIVAVAALVLAACPAFAQTGPAAASVQEQVGTERSAAGSQERINKLDEETQRLLNDYRLSLRETESLRRYNQQLELQIQSQENEMVSIEKQIIEIERTNREIVPLMQRMIETLEAFVKLDLPFLPDERAKRVVTLKEIMNRADVSTAEKYRRILEAYQVEMEYGRTIEAYQGKIGEGDEAKTVDFLRVGRVALMYQALDGDETGYWDAEGRKWVEDNDYRGAVKAGLKVARKQGAPDLLTVPVKAAKKEGA